MSKVKPIVLWICLLALLVGVACRPKEQEETGSAVEKLLQVMPDDVVGFVATSGGDELKGTFEKSILGRIWNDPGVQSFCQSIRKEVLRKVEEGTPGGDTGEIADIRDEALQYFLKTFNSVMDLVEPAIKRPIIIGVAQRQVKGESPIYGFAILDAGRRKAEIASALAKVEALAGEDEIVEIKVQGLKMQGTKEPGSTPGYWGWVGDYFVFALNDGEGLAMKYLRGNSRRSTPAYFKGMPSGGDALAVHIDYERIFDIFGTVAREEGLDDAEFDRIKAGFNEFGLGEIETLSARMGFVGADMVSNNVVRLKGPRTGLLACLGTIDLSMFDTVDEGALSAAAFSCDFGHVYDTILRTIKAAAPNDIYAEAEEGIAAFESETGISVKGFLRSLAGPIVAYSLPAGVMMDAPSGGGVMIAKLKDARQWEKTMTALEDFAKAQSGGMVQVSSQVEEGRTLHCWVIAPLAMMQIMPTWTIVDNHVVIGSSTGLCNRAIRQIVSGQSGGSSLRTTEGFRKATEGLPKNLIGLSYTDSQVYFNQMIMRLQQYWPMATMLAGRQGIELPFMLPSLGHIIEEMGPSCQYSWFDAEGLRSRYQGPGVEIQLGLVAVAGGTLAVAILTPPMARTRELAERMVSGSNLSGIGKACGIYAFEDEHGKYPPNLEKLVELDYISAKQLESKLKPKGFDGPGYIYISGQSAASDPGNIVAYDNPEFCYEGVNAVFVDGHVQWMKPEEFLQALEATYKRLGREMPEIEFKGTGRYRRMRRFEPIPMPPDE